jgi:hypothetical protein
VPDARHSTAARAAAELIREEARGSPVMTL